MKKKLNNFLYILGNFRKKFIKSTTLYLSSSILDVIVLMMLPSLIASFFEKSSSINLFFYKIEFNEKDGILIIGGIILLLTYLKGFVNYKSISYIIRLSGEVQRENRKKIFSFYKKIYINNISKSNLEKYLNYTTYVVGVFSENVLFKLITVISELVIIFIICIYLLTVDPFVLLGLIFFFSTIFIGYFFLIRKFIFIAGKKQAASMQRLVEITNSIFKGFKEIKVLKLDSFFDKEFGQSNEEFYRYNVDYQKLIFLPKFLIEVIMITFVILLFFFNKFFSNSSLLDNVETIGVFIFAALRIAPMAYNIFSSTSQISSSWYSVDQLSLEFKKINFLQNKVKDKKKSNNKIFNSRSVIDKVATVDLRNIFFKYKKNQNKYILKNVNLNLTFGTCIGIKGNSGSGKTTLINILLGLLNPQKGRIIINKKYESCQTNFNDKISYTPQDIFLEKGSILNNIVLGQKKNKININKVIVAAKNAQILSFINTTNNKKIFEILKKTNVENLSGGQLQRVAIARTLYYEKEICVFDEFTSALDLNSEDKIVKHLNKIKKNRIIIIISHRSNAMKYCDKIYELNNGSFK
jgi:ABC-type multidrug transport system fused ATPase/permease subunit